MQNINKNDTQKKRILVLGGGGYSRPFTEHGETVITDAMSIKDMDRVATFDLVVFTGGHDVSPSLYHEKKHRHTQPYCARDVAEQLIFKECIEHNIKMVGICRGSQFLTVMNGGSLVQHVENHGIGGTHPIKTQLDVELQVTSTHHQMMRPDGKYELLAYAEGRSDIYEGEGDVNTLVDFKRNEEGQLKEPEVVWYPDTMCLAVQYHPEYMGEDTEGYKYFQKLLEEYVL